MRSIATATAVALLVASPVFSQDKAETEDELPLIKHCLAATAVDELQECVRRLAKGLEAGRALRRTELKIVGVCVERETVQELRECLAILVRPETPEQRKQSEELQAAVRTWDVSKGTSRMDSSGLVHLTLESEDEISLGYGKRARPLLALRCRENTTALFVSSDWYLAENVSVQWRIDQEKPAAQTWNGSTNHKAAGLWDGGRSIPLIKSMLGKKTFLIRITTYNEGAREMSFNIEGLDKVIEPLRTACKW